MRYTLVLFDLDGTLVDSLPDIGAALNAGLAGLGRPALSLPEVQTLVGEGVVRLAEKALVLRPPPDGTAENPQQAQALAESVRDIYRARPCVQSRLFPGIVELLRTLRDEPARRLAVLTNKPGEVTRPLLAALGIDQLLHAAIGDGDGYPRKPDPGAARALAERFACDPDQVLMVGDGVPDLLMARQLGCASAAALWGYTPPDELTALAPTHVLHTPADALAIT